LEPLALPLEPLVLPLESLVIVLVAKLPLRKSFGPLFSGHLIEAEKPIFVLLVSLEARIRYLLHCCLLVGPAAGQLGSAPLVVAELAVVAA